MKILQYVYLNILNSYPIPPPEQGGILGMKNGIVCEYHHDNSGNITDRAIYEPDVNVFNERIEEWDEHGIQFAGIIHSHLSGQNTLSSGDIEYIKQIFNNLPEWIDELYFPVVIPEQKTVNGFIVKNNGKKIVIESCEINIVLDERMNKNEKRI